MNGNSTLSQSGQSGHVQDMPAVPGGSGPEQTSPATLPSTFSNTTQTALEDTAVRDAAAPPAYFPSDAQRSAADTLLLERMDQMNSRLTSLAENMSAFMSTVYKVDRNLQILRIIVSLHDESSKGTFCGIAACPWSVHKSTRWPALPLNCPLPQPLYTLYW